MAALFFLLYIVFTLIILYRSLPALVWGIGTAVYVIVATCFWGPFFGFYWLIGLALWSLLLFTFLLLYFEPLRAAFTDYVYRIAEKSIPKLSATEEEALNAGDTWLERDVFIGAPDWECLSSISTTLTKEEQSFLDHETQHLCGLLNEWEIKQALDLPASVWTYIKEKGFFGLVIPKEYGGKGFSARAHSEVIAKISSHCLTAAVTVMVPNSLGPAELLRYYGTEEQKAYYLPRLAKGLEIPCFALTEPYAGSDATSLQSTAIVIHQEIDGQNVLGLQLSLDKRWITLAPVATLIGLAVNLKDPNKLLQGEGCEGITCLLIPRDTPHLEIGNRHLPCDQPFMNGTIRGKDLFVPITTIIGGQKNAGLGWPMLVECLSIGRSISLPAVAASSAAVAYLSAGAFSRIRQQFNIELAQFEGVAEKLAEIAGLSYLINATRLLTLAAVDDHKKPSVASAIAKYFNTELARQAVTSAMDIHGGRTVVLGPRNYLYNIYQSMPISITVEGANIMSRNLLIFGQGSMACHPFIREEFYALSSKNKEVFSQLIWQHISYFLGNLAKAICSTWTGGLFIKAPAGPMRRQYQHLARLSHAYAWLADLSLIYLGGDLKRKERLSARLADGMSYLYMAQAVLREVEIHDDPDDRLHADWALSYCFYHAQKAMLDLCRHFRSKFLGLFMRLIAFPFGQTMSPPSDMLDEKLAALMSRNNHYRDRLKKMLYLSGDPSEALDRTEEALQQLIQKQPLLDKLKDLKRFHHSRLDEKLKKKQAEGLLSQEEVDAYLALEKARWEAILVDEFTFDSLKTPFFQSVTDKMKSPL